ncbi:hypothetical protein [Clostridium estertheticum]|uniref:hypothetical protein n=1 Tax=Clostridium estertheticum TaxID=238834 RepID=UPI001CF156BF|nr:hypothetical protein [Clostridium estertheticum]MCB2353542.1 hypothetical protein [Clostridium estertheticum]WAG41877.1 hypothetical protein LL065_03985 [Clostridium estertheticum]
MKKKFISSLLVSLMITGTSSLSAFAAMANGTVVIGSKSFDLAYANDTANFTVIRNAILEGGKIYVKDFSGTWTENSTGKTVDPSIVPGEDQNGSTTELDSIKGKSLYTLDMKDNTGVNYSVYVFSDDNQLALASNDSEDWAFTWAGAYEGDNLSKGHYNIAVSKDGDTNPKIYDAYNNEEQVLNLDRDLIRVHKNIQDGQPDFLLMGTPSGTNSSEMKVYYIKDGILNLANFTDNRGSTNSVYTYSSQSLFFNQLDKNIFETSFYNNMDVNRDFGFYISSCKFDLATGNFNYLKDRFMDNDDYFNYAK